MIPSVRAAVATVLALFATSAAAESIRVKSLTLAAANYLHRDEPADGNTIADARLELEGRGRVGGAGAFFSATLHADNRDLSSSVTHQIHDRMAKRPAFSVNEAYVEWEERRLKVRAGKQKILWGRADGVNPTDRFAVRDYTDLIDPERLGVAALRADLFLDGASLQLVAAPFYSPSRLGQPTTRWRPTLDGLPAAAAPFSWPANSGSNGSYGIKLDLERTNWEGSVSYSRAINPLSGGRRLGGQIVEPFFNKQRALGFDFSRGIAAGSCEVHAEAAWVTTVGGRADDYLQYVFGGRRAFIDVVADHDLDLGLEWAGEYVTSRRRDPLINEQSALDRWYKGSALIDADLEITEFVTWSVSGGYTVKGRDSYLVSTEISWRATDLLALTAGFDALSGKGGSTTAALYERNDRLRLEATVYFR